MSYIDKIMQAHPDWPRRIRHGEYTGVLIDVQPLLAGDASPIYRFDGGDAVGADYEVSAVRIPAKENDNGMVHCGSCGAELLCNEYGDMPDVCPTCHEGVDWSAWEVEAEKLKPGDKVVMNENYYVSEENRGKVWSVRSKSWVCCGTLVVLLEGKSGGYAVDGLDLVKEG